MAQAPVSSQLPFDISRHPVASAHVAKRMNARLAADVKCFSQAANPASIPTLMGFERDMSAHAAGEAAARMGTLRAALWRLAESDRARSSQAEARVCVLVNQAEAEAEAGAAPEEEPWTSRGSEQERRKRRLFELGRRCGEELTIGFELLVQLLLSQRVRLASTATCLFCSCFQFCKCNTIFSML